VQLSESLATWQQDIIKEIDKLNERQRIKSATKAGHELLEVLHGLQEELREVNLAQTSAEAQYKSNVAIIENVNETEDGSLMLGFLAQHLEAWRVTTSETGTVDQNSDMSRIWEWLVFLSG
jgi:hypothetical protein